jgi:hypothetical protein
MPLDMALEHEQVSVRRIREKARAYFRTNPPPDLERMMQEYTFLIPQAMKEKWSPGELLGLSEISAAVKYRRHYWELYLEKFTTAKEAAGRDPYTMRFEVELDLAIFCGYRQPVRNLVAGGS